MPIFFSFSFPFFFFSSLVIGSSKTAESLIGCQVGVAFSPFLFSFLPFLHEPVPLPQTGCAALRRNGVPEGGMLRRPASCSSFLPFFFPSFFFFFFFLNSSSSA